MNSVVDFQMVIASKGFNAHVTNIRFDSSMGSHMCLQITWPSEYLTTHIINTRFSLIMSAPLCPEVTCVRDNVAAHIRTVSSDGSMNSRNPLQAVCLS